MFSLRLANKYKKESVCHTRSMDRFEFTTEICHKDIYVKSPFYKGVCLWNSIPIGYQNMIDSRCFKGSIKKHLSIFLLTDSNINILISSRK